MGLPHISLATIEKPEFINLQPSDISPLISKCEIKVFYIGMNRNGSYISKDSAMEMAKTLRGNPIVGSYKKEKGDFTDHGQKIVIEGGKIFEECTTRPYGFVNPNARVWFQKFQETDEKGENIIREYLMTEGLLWTGQYEEAKLAFDGGRPHSMELDHNSLDGEWSKNNAGIDFFIINDAIISKLCILGEDVEPCFEGSSITEPNISTSFCKVDKNFVSTLYSMMSELKNALEGGLQMSKEQTNETKSNEETPILFFEEGGDAGSSDAGGDAESSEADIEAAQAAEDAAAAATEATDAALTVSDAIDSIEDAVEDALEPSIEADEAEILIESKVEEAKDGVQTAIGAASEAETQADIADEASKKEGATEAATASATAAAASAEVAATAAENAIEALDLDTIDNAKGTISDLQGLSKKNDFELKFKDLQERYNVLEKEVSELREYKNKIESEKKDKLFKKFSMISQEILTDLQEKKEQFSFEELKSKLSIAYAETQIDFQNDENEEEQSQQPVLTFSENNNEICSLPSWLRAVKETRDNREE